MSDELILYSNPEKHMRKWEKISNRYWRVRLEFFVFVIPLFTTLIHWSKQYQRALLFAENGKSFAINTNKIWAKWQTRGVGNRRIYKHRVALSIGYRCWRSIKFIENLKEEKNPLTRLFFACETWSLNQKYGLQLNQLHLLNQCS